MTTEALNMPRNELASQDAAATRLANAERENLLQVLRARYVAPQRMRKHHKDTVKMIKSLEQGYDGTVAMCFFCKTLQQVTKMQLHHTTYDVSDNRLEVLEICDQECNNKDHAVKRLATLNPSSPRQGESELSAPTHATGEGQGSPELVKHNAMRPRYDRWMRDLVNGPFANQHSWPRDLLAEKAPYSCSTKLGEAFGSSKTYLKFIKEDSAYGLLNVEDREGTIFVTLNRDMLKKIQDQNGQ